MQRAMRSGLAFPNRPFMPSVIMKAIAHESARPIQPVFHSQSLRRQIRAFPEPVVVGPGTKIMTMKKMMMAGAIKDTTTRTAVETVSLTSG